jgi:hypothetical protein
MKQFSKSHSRQTSFEEPFSDFEFTSTPAVGGIGTVSIFNGEPGETITFDFTLVIGAFTGVNLSFSAPMAVGSLEAIHLTRTGTMLLDGSGNGTSTFTFTPSSGYDAYCDIELTTRSSGETEGIGQVVSVG